MKIGRLLLIAVMTLVAAAAAIAAIFYFKDEILERIADVKKILDQKKTKIFRNNEYTDYADI
jgi:ABC-type transport system involved in cytochrome bd biosynthesis fused ATPase/permease subunit